MNKQINSTSFSMMISALNKCLFLGLLIPYMFNVAKTSTVVSVFIGFIIGLVIFAVIMLLFNSKSDLSIVGKAKECLPKPFYFIIVHIQIFIVSMLASMLLWRLASFTTNEYLSETPTFLVAMLMAIPIFYISINNFTVLCRFNTMCFLIGLFIIIFNFFGLLPHFDANNFKPFLIDELGSILNASVHYAFLSACPIFMLTIIPKNNISDKKKFNKKMIISFIYSNVMGFFIFFAVQMSLHIELINLYTYPAFAALKIINLANFIDAVENISSILWYIYINLSISMCMIFIKYSITEFYNIKSKKINTIIGLSTAFLTLLIVFPFANFSYFLDKISIMKIPFYLMVALFISFLIILFSIKIKNRN